MRLLVLSDMHGDTANIEKLAPEFEKADAVVFAGDFTEFNKPETGEPAFKSLITRHDFIYAVIGNCDDPDFIENLEDEDISIQKNLVVSDHLCWLGSGGGLKFTGTTPNELDEEGLMADLTPVTEIDEAVWDNLILVTHQPPYDTGMDKITAGIATGSKEIRAFIEKYQPLVAISGHIHESFAVNTLGPTTLMNPGSLAEGRYGIIELQRTGSKWSVTSATLHQL